MKLNWTARIPLTGSGVSRIREIAGVYRLIYYNPSDQKYYVYYVGQAENLKERLQEHLIMNETNKCCLRHLNNYSCYFRAAVVENQSERNGAEVALYNYFGPSCVERIPDVRPLDINFH